MYLASSFYGFMLLKPREIDGKGLKELCCLSPVNKADALSALKGNRVSLDTHAKLWVPGPRLSKQPVPAPDGGDGVLHRLRGGAVQRGGAAAETLHWPQR